MTHAARSEPSHSRRAPYHAPRTAEDLTEQNVRAIVELDRAARETRSAGQRIAEQVTAFCGTLRFVVIHVVWFVAWIAFNSWPGLPHPDPYPFTLLTMVVSLEAIFLSTFVLISQNQETRLSERRNALDLQINLLAEQENTKTLRMLERIAQRLGITFDDDPTLGVLERATRPDRLAEQIDRVQNGQATR